MTKMTSDTRENFRDDRARRQGCAQGGQAAGRGRMRAQRGESQSNPVIMGARSVVATTLLVYVIRRRNVWGLWEGSLVRH